MTKTFFVAGTDTGAGKTLVTAALLTAAGQGGLQTLGLKPLAAGCDITADGPRNSDALQLHAAASIQLPYELINPVALANACAPHIAAQQQGTELSLALLSERCREAISHAAADICFIEGAGGWRVPLNRHSYLSQLAESLAIPVILVVGLRLGCLNHSILSAEAIKRDGLVLAGWVATTPTPDLAFAEDNIEFLRQYFQCPLLGVIPHLPNPTPGIASSYVDISKLL